MRVIFNKALGKSIEIDPIQAKYARMCRRVFSWAEQLEGIDSDTYMITLTYGNGNTWAKGDISRFMELFSGRKRSHLFDVLGYAWVAEMQLRGEVHYHIIVCVPKGSAFYSAVANRRKWNSHIVDGIGFPDELGHWTKGNTGVDIAETKFYIVSYTAKEYQKFSDFPKGCRTYGLYLNRKYIQEIQLQRFHVSVAPVWLTERIKASPDLQGLKIKRVSGGYEVGGVFCPTPYNVGYSKGDDYYSYHKELWGLTGENLRELGFPDIGLINDYLSSLDKSQDGDYISENLI